MNRKGRPTGPDPSSGFTDDMRAFMTTRFAMRYSVTQVLAMLQEEFGLESHKCKVNRYNFDSVASKTTGARWRKLFDEMREKYREDLASIPLVDKNTRLRQLDQLAWDAIADGRHDEAAKFMKQIAEEVGNVHTNERVIKGKISVNTEEQPSIEEMRNLLADRIAEAFEADPIQPTAPGTATTQ